MSTDDTPRAAARLGRALAALGPLLALAAVWTGFALLEHRLEGTPFLGSAMFTREAVAQVVQQSVVIGIAAIGMTFVIISAGIDLSVGSAIALASVIAAKLAVAGHGAAAVVLGTLAAGGLTGLLIGLLIVRAGLIPFITTLGTLLVLRGAALGLAGSQPITSRTSAGCGSGSTDSRPVGNGWSSRRAAGSCWAWPGWPPPRCD